MTLINAKERAALLRNGRYKQVADWAGLRIPDLKPVVRLFIRPQSWLIADVFPHDDHRAYGLWDKGFGRPEMSLFDLGELASYRGPHGPLVERDTRFKADKTLWGYHWESRNTGTREDGQ